MNLLLQLLPYAAFAGIVTTAITYYVIWTSKRRRARPTPHRAVQEASRVAQSPMERLNYSARATSSVVSPVAGKTQILRLCELGISEGHIAAALQVPLQEVQIVVTLERVRRPTAVPSEIPQPSIVE